MKRLANFVCAMLLLPIMVLAQSTTQSIQGLVTDSTGAVVPGATVPVVDGVGRASEEALRCARETRVGQRVTSHTRPAEARPGPGRRAPMRAVP